LAKAIQVGVVFQRLSFPQTRWQLQNEIAKLAEMAASFSRWTA
jgi:hypothetical protein